MQFKKPPLVELIAEFRWAPGGGLVQSNQGFGAGQVVTMPMVDPSLYEAFFANFSTEIASHGYVRSERLVPAGWPYPLHMPVCRFRHSKFENSQSTLYQVGAGLFSVHAVPPYKNWEEFKPVISTGLSVLMKSRPAGESDSKFSTIVLRYIDRFSPELTGNLQPRDFIERVFRVRLELLDAIREEAEDERLINPTIAMRIPLKSGLLMTLGINPTTQPASPGIVLDTTVASQNSVASDVSAAMGVLETAHMSIRRVFTGLTQPIFDKMEPE